MTRSGPLSKLESRAALVLETMLGLWLVGMVVVNVLDGLGRYVVLSSTVGVDELTVYSMILIVMIGAFLTAWRREHLSNVLLQTRLSGPSRRGVLISIGMVTIGVCGLIALSSFDSVQRVAAFDQTRMRLGVPTALPFFAVIAGFAGMALAAIQHLSGEDAPAHFGGEP